MIHSSGDRFADRRHAGQRLAAALSEQDLPAPIVFALPRGGVPVGHEVAAELGAPLEVIVARKVGMPGHEEYAIGAVAEGAGEVVVSDSAAAAGLGERRFEAAVARTLEEVARRVEHYRGGVPLPSVEGRTAIVVDDGLATGATAEAALGALRAEGPDRLLLALPVGAPDSVQRLAGLAEIVCLRTPSTFRAVGRWYADFGQTSDGEVLDLLGRS